MKTLYKLRKKIDKVDNNIIDLLKKRLILSNKIGKYKKENNLKIIDIAREKELYQRIIKKSKKNKLDEKFIKNIYNIIIRESRLNQK